MSNLRLHDSYKIVKGQLFFTPDNIERKITGSYYTPDLIVKFLIKNSIGNSLKIAHYSDILNLRICDPSMGSGHFLAGVLDYLVQLYREKWAEEHNDDLRGRQKISAHS